MKILSVFLLTILTVTVAFADLAPGKQITPTPEKSVQSNLNLRTNPNISEPTLTIPKSLIKELNAQIEAEENKTATASVSSDYGKTSTVVSGMFLSLAFIFGGVFLFKNKSSKTAVGLILLAICSASATIIYANVAPPAIEKMDSSLFNERMKRSYRGAVGKVNVKISDNTSRIDLVIPRVEEKGKTEEE